MHSVTRRSLRVQKQMFDVTYPNTLFMESVPGPPELKNGVLMFHARTQGNALFKESVPGPLEHEK
jgi:hypothetical protein